jgi:hypothetical protein
VKRCSTCGQSKSPEKFYGEMAHCKACHNGVTMPNLRRATETKGRQSAEPSEDQIAEACLLIQQRWSKKKKASRKRGKVLA